MARKTKVKSIGEWLTSQCFANAEQFGPCKEFQLRHIGVQGQEGALVDRFVPPEQPSDDAIASIELSIKQAAEVDASALSRVQKYAIFALFDEGGELAIKARYLFLQSSSDDILQEGVQETEPSTTAGQIAQLQRHNEALMRLLTVGQGTVLDSYAKLTDRLAAMNDKLIEEKFQYVESAAEMLSKKDERISKQRESEMTLSMKQQIGKDFLGYAPIMLNKLLGGKLLPEGVLNDKAKAKIKEFAESLSPEQFNQMISPLSQGQQAVMVELFQEMMADKNGASSNEAQTEAKENANVTS